MQLIRHLLRLYLSKFPITEGKKYIYMFAKKYFIPKQTKIISKMKYGFYLKLNLQNPEHQYYYFYMSHDERYEINNLQNIIQSSDICWDIGANIGFYSFLFSSIVNDGEVVAFEPISKTYDDLKIAKEINKYKNIKVNNYALGSHCEDKKIFHSHSDLSIGTASFLNSDLFKNSELVHINTIDDICNGLKIPDFLKIDVEGFQEEVIKGASVFFQNNAPLIMIEIDRNTGQWLEDYFLSLNYQFYRFHKNHISQVDSIFSNGRNILFCKGDSIYSNRINRVMHGK